MDKKSNMKQAMFEMFGVGSGAPEAAASDAPAETPAGAQRIAAPEQEKKAPEKKLPEKKAPAAEERPAEKPARPAASYLAPGTVFEGSLRAAGDVEIAGEFKGDIVTEGTAMLHSNIQSNVTAGSLNLERCSLVGNVTASGTVTVSEGSRISGNVTAKELLCAGEIIGDLNISGNTSLEAKAQINGSVTTGTMAVVKGAVIKGSVEMKRSGAEE